MEPTTQTPPTTAPAPALSLLLSEKALEASRTEILVLASGILFLASQVCLLVWILRRAGGTPAAPEKKEGRKISIVLPAETITASPAINDIYDDGVSATGKSNVNSNNDSLVRLRRSSTWGGRSSHQGSRPWGRRKSAGSRRKAYGRDDDGNDEDEGEEKGPQTSLSSPGPALEPEPESEAGHDALTAFGDIGRMAAALASPAALPLHSGGGRDTEDTELSELDPRGDWDETGMLGASIKKPSSPRSPRVLAADQAAMMDALCAEGDEEDSKAAAPSPVGGVGRDSFELISGFDDPLGVNRLVAFPREDEEAPEEVELESRGGRN